MRTIIVLTLASIILFSCTERQPQQMLLIEKDLSTGNPFWKQEGDTLRNEFKFTGTKGLEIDFKVTWTTAMDTAGVYHVSYFRLEKTNANKNVEISDARFYLSDVGGDWNNGDTRSFDMVTLYANLKAPKEEFNGVDLCTVTGLKEFRH